MNKNFKQIIDPRKDIGKLTRYFPNAKIVDFELSDAFCKFKEEFIYYLNRFLDIHNFNKISAEKILRRYNIHSHYISIVSEGDQINFFWPNGELKSFSIFTNAIVTNDSYWLRSYPFLELDRNYCMARINMEFKNKADSLEIADNILTSPSHNNHFGHFIFDDYPRCFLDSINFNASVDDPLATTPMNKGIREMLEQIGYLDVISEREFSQAGKKKNHILHSKRLHHSYITNPIVNIYILRSIFNQLAGVITYSKSQDLSKSYFLYRGGKYKSRIANFEEIKQFLISENFQVIDPTSLSNMELLSKLRAARQIVCESGSTTLVASLFSQLNCRIISLMPEEMVNNPDDDMRESGLPYHLIRPSLMKIVRGKSVSASLIQSSSLCLYNINELSKVVE